MGKASGKYQGMRLEDLAEAMVKCSHCAFCQAACPVFKEDLLETHMPRARMEIIGVSLLDRELSPTRRVREIVDRCLLCSSCTHTCPANVPVDDVVAAARNRLGAKSGKNPFVRLGRKKFMESRGLSGMYAAVGRSVRNRGLLPDELPPIAREPLSLAFAPGEQPHESPRRARAAYFAGCATNAGYTDTGRDVLDVLARNGVEAVLVPELVCCGMPAFAEGDFAYAARLAEKNVEALSRIEADALVCDCTSCAYMFARKIPALLGPDHPLAEKAAALAAKTAEVTDYLARLGLSAELGTLAETYTYHVPCHAKFSETLAEAPRELLTRIPGLTLIEMDQPDACCGAGGGFFLGHRDLSMAIREKKLSDIGQTGASAVATQCPSCRGFLSAPLAGKTRVVHPVTILARSMRRA
ncbi:MAG: (Fe-S)-binding protein [Deltaproteobacteria bacterium]|nr:(Fe-S)-binding protein [Deltaproteobacteria bacterium]